MLIGVIQMCSGLGESHGANSQRAFLVLLHAPSVRPASAKIDVHSDKVCGLTSGASYEQMCCSFVVADESYQK